jgi:hypothetical protein
MVTLIKRFKTSYFSADKTMIWSNGKVHDPHNSFNERVHPAPGCPDCTFLNAIVGNAQLWMQLLLFSTFFGYICILFVIS